jgi:hypothetical protein
LNVPQPKPAETKRDENTAHIIPFTASARVDSLLQKALYIERTHREDV